MSSTFITTPGEAIFKNPSNAVYLAEIIFYALAFVYSIVIIFVQGWKNADGWVNLLIFNLMKLVGSAVLIAVAVDEHNGTDPSTALVTVGLILSTISLGPLELASLGFLSRGTTSWQKQNGGASAAPRWKIVIRLVVIAATVLSIAGTVQLSNGDKNTSTSIVLIKVSTIIFLVAYLLILAAAVLCYSSIGNGYHPDFTHYIFALFVATPFFFVRIAFSIASGFSTSGNLETYHRFSSFNGDWRIKLGMAVITEFIIDIIFSIAGYTVELHNRQRARVEMAPSSEEYAMGYSTNKV